VSGGARQPSSFCRVRRCKAAVVVLLVLSAAWLAGCKTSDQAVLNSGTGPGLTGAEATSGGKLLWVWPPPSGSGGAGPTYPAAPDDPRIAYFRFADVPAEGSLRVSITPYTPHLVWYTGNIVMVVPEAPEPDVAYEVAVSDAGTGALLGRATLHVPRWPSAGEAEVPGGTSGSGQAMVTVTEFRSLSYTYTGGGDANISETGPHYPPLADGETVMVSFGDVLLCVEMPGDVPVEVARSAFTLEPPVPIQCVPVPGGMTQVLARWPGVAASARFDYPAGMVRINYGKVRLPDPDEVLGSSHAPFGFAKEMVLTIDAAKLPPTTGIAALAGDDGRFRVRVVRTTAAKVTVTSPENLHGPHMVAAPGGRTLLPYPDPRDQWSLRPEPHTLVFAFTKPMNRGSVERSLVTSGPAPGSLVWTFDWLSDDTVKVVVSPTDAAGKGFSSPSTALLSEPPAVDVDGLPLWFCGTLWVRWCEPVELARVPAVAAGGDQGPAREDGCRLDFRRRLRGCGRHFRLPRP